MSYTPAPHIDPERLPPPRSLTRKEVLHALHDLSVEAMEYGEVRVLCGTYWSRALIDARTMLEKSDFSRPSATASRGASITKTPSK